MSSEKNFLPNGTPSTEGLDEHKAALAVIISAFGHGLRPDLPMEYLFDYVYNLVEEMVDGDFGVSNEDALQLGQLLADAVKPPTKDDTRH